MEKQNEATIGPFQIALDFYYRAAEERHPLHTQPSVGARPSVCRANTTCAAQTHDFLAQTHKASVKSLIESPCECSLNVMDAKRKYFGFYVPVWSCVSPTPPPQLSVETENS